MLKDINGLNCDAFAFRLTKHKRLVVIILDGNLKNDDGVKSVKILSADGHYNKLAQGLNKSGMLLKW